MFIGGGKFLCYQLLVFMLEGMVFIIFLFIVLMKNQVDFIRGYSQCDEVVYFLNFLLIKVQMKQVKQDIIDGKIKLLFIVFEILIKEENIQFF